MTTQTPAAAAAAHSNNRPAPLDAPAGALIVALRAAPEGDPLWTKEGDARWIARNAPMDVLLRAGDLLRIPHVDFYSQISLAEEVTRAARGPAIAATAGSYPGHRGRELNAVGAIPYTVTGWFITNAGPSLHYTLEGPNGQVLDYWRMPGGTTGAQIKAGNRWLELGDQDPRYQAVITGVREHEAGNPDFAGYNNPPAGSTATTQSPHAGPAAGTAAPGPAAAMTDSSDSGHDALHGLAEGAGRRLDGNDRSRTGQFSQAMHPAPDFPHAPATSTSAGPARLAASRTATSLAARTAPQASRLAKGR